MSVTDEIKSRLNIVDVIGSTVQLKKAGRLYKGLCPFHHEKTPSFVVYPDSQNWRCYGACAEGGDIFNFIMKRESWDFGEALRFLAGQAGVDLEPYDTHTAQKSEERDRLQSLLRDTAYYFNHLLANAPEAQHARDYVAKRSLSAETIDAFGIGYSPNSWDALSKWLLDLGYTPQELVDAGVVVVKEEGGTYDRFRDRLIIPIRDVKGNVVGFGARGFSADQQPKYLNSPQSALFDKSHLLFGLDLARRTIRESDLAVIVEGYMDTLQAHQAGFSNVVAQMALP
jgi:DNA primase